MNQHLRYLRWVKTLPEDVKKTQKPPNQDKDDNCR